MAALRSLRGTCAVQVWIKIRSSFSALRSKLRRSTKQVCNPPGKSLSQIPQVLKQLKEDYAPARKLIDAGCAVALATDLNPGSCFSDSIVSSNGQEDHVSMGANAAIKLYRIMNNLDHILAIELMNAAQGIEFRRPLKSSPKLEAFLKEYRKEVPFVREDIVMYKEIHKTVAFLNRTRFQW